MVAYHASVPDLRDFLKASLAAWNADDSCEYGASSENDLGRQRAFF